MNEKGAAAQSAVAIVVSKGVQNNKPLFLIDKPFYVWVERPGMSLKLFTAYIDTPHWKEPKGLEIKGEAEMISKKKA